MLHIWSQHCAISREVAGSIPDGVTGFYIDLILPDDYDPEVKSDSNGNEYWRYLLEGEVGQCVRLTTLPHSVSIV